MLSITRKDTLLFSSLSMIKYGILFISRSPSRDRLMLSESNKLFENSPHGIMNRHIFSSCYRRLTSTVAVSIVLSIFIVATICTPGISWNASGITVAGVTGVNGSNATLLMYTNDVDIDIYGNIYVADTDNQRIQRFPSNSLIGQIVAGTGTAGSGVQLNHPRAIFIVGDALYISDIYNYRIQRYSYNAASGTTVAGGKDQISAHCGDAFRRILH